MWYPKMVPLFLLAGLMACGGHTVTSPQPLPSPTVSPSPSPSPEPSPTMTSCPPLVKWGAHVFNIMNGAFQPQQLIERDGYVVIDSTPKFQLGGPNGQPCNEEHPCGRDCEDPRGGRWEILNGGSPSKIQNPGPDTGFQFRWGPLVAGSHKVKVCPLPDLVDGLGVPVEFLAGSCEIVQFNVD